MNRMGKIYNIGYIFISLALFILCGCQERLPSAGTTDASLQIKLSAPGYGLEVKSVSSEPDNPAGWTAWERAVDGRYIYEVAAFILQGNRLVAHKALSLEGEAKEAVIDFEANFTHGSYTLMVVANYSPHEADDGENGVKRYEGLGSFNTVVQEILTLSAMDNFKEIYGNSFLNYKISSIEGICERVPQPLTLVKEIELHPGTNTISGELLRTYSRIRISVENNSDDELLLSTMSFSDIFTQTSAYIFEGQGYLPERRTLDVTSANALTPFTGTETAPMTIPAKESAVVFDAYILESIKSSENESYSYSLGLGYENLDSYKLGSTTSIRYSSNIEKGYYMIYNRNAARYLTAGMNSVTASTLGTLSKGMQIPKEYVWTLDNSGLQSGQFYIGTCSALDEGETSYYINDPTRTSVTLGSRKSVYFTFTDRSSYMSVRSSGSGNYRYLSVSGGAVIGQRNNNSYNALFELYPIEVPKASNVHIPVSTIDNATGQAVEVDEIKRNDFINAVVKVSYSKNQGHFKFEVLDWYSGGGDVEFN